MPLLGPKEKGELESLILKEISDYWEAHGSSRLLDAGRGIALDVSGPLIVDANNAHCLAFVEIRTLFTALCHLSADGPGSMPRDSLESLATEATSSLAAQINRLVPD